MNERFAKHQKRLRRNNRKNRKSWFAKWKRCEKIAALTHYVGKRRHEMRINERELMKLEDIRSRKIEVFNRIMEAKKGKKKKKGGKKKGKK